MKYRGRELDPISLWSNYVDLPNANIDGEFLPLTYCPNPNHPNHHSPAFQINVERPLVHCFSYCGISGNYARAISIIEGIHVKEADAIIRSRLKIAVPGQRRKRRTQTVHVEKEVRLDKYSYLPPAGLAYLEEREITGESVARFELGFDREEERIIIPARDHRGTVRFLIHRAIYDRQMPKYLYDGDSDRQAVLFGACYCDMPTVQSEGLIVVEGSLDAIKLHQHGLRNAVALLGSHASEQQIRVMVRMRPKRIYMMFDRDSAGVRALDSSVAKLPKVPLFVCRYPSGKFDPAELSRREAHRSVERAITVRKFNQKRKEFSIGSPSQ